MRFYPRLALTSLALAAACSDQPFVTDVPFRVTSVSPSPGAAGADRGAPIVITFSEDLVEESVTTAEAFKVESVAADGKTSVIQGTYAYGQVGDAPYAAKFTPKVPGGDARALPYSTTVRVSLSTKITRKRDGGVLATPVTFEFRTEDPPPLAITRLQPSDGVSGFGRTGAVSVTFSEPVDCAAFAAGGVVTFLEQRDAHPHWKNADAPEAGVPVPGEWRCPALPDGDKQRLEGSCSSSTEGDTTDYCTVTFRYAADGETDAAQKLAKSLGRSSGFTLSLPGADGATPELGTLVHSARATRLAAGDGKFTLHGALSQTAKVTGHVEESPPLALVAISPRQGEVVVAGADRLTDVKLQFSEQVDCARLADAVTIEETFDPKVVADRGLSSNKRTVGGTWDCTAGSQNRENFACGAGGGSCTYTFTPAVPAGSATPFAFSSRVDVKLAGGAFGTAPRVESVRSTSLSGQLPADVAFSFRIADPAAFGLVAASPGPLSAGVARDAALSFTFTEPPDCAALAAATKVEETLDEALGGAKATVAGTWTCAPLPTENASDPGAIYACNSSGNCTATFTPTSPLRWSSKIDVTLKGGATTAGGTAVVRSARATERSGSLAQTASWSFRVQDPPALLVNVSGPAAGASGVPRDAKIVVAFSEPVDCDVLEELASVREKRDAAAGSAEAAVAGSWACVDRPEETSANFGTVYGCPDAAACSATFTPAASFGWSSRVTVSLPGSAHPGDAIASTRATSRGGRLLQPVTVTFDVVDPPPLTLVSAAPGPGSSGVATDAEIILTFDDRSEGIGCDSIVVCDEDNLATCTLAVLEIADPLVGGTDLGDEEGRLRGLLPVDVDCTDGDTVVTLTTPDFDLSSDVEVSLAGGAPGEALESAIATTKGGQLPSEISWKFTVRAPDPLTLVALSPSGGAVGIAPSPTLEATFDRELDCDSLDESNLVVTVSSPALADGTGAGSPAPVDGTIACDGDTLTFAPDDPIAASSLVEVTLGTGSVATTIRAPDATSLGGFLAGPVTASFRIADPLHLTIVAAEPAGNPATRVSATSDVRFTFDRAVRCATATSRVTLIDTEDDEEVDGTVLCTNGTDTGPDVDGVTVIFAPSAALTVSHTYRAMVEAGVEAVGATLVDSEVYGALPQDYDVSFVVTAEDLRVTATSPGGGSTGAPVGVNLALTFNQDVSFASIIPCAAGGTTPNCNLWVAPASSAQKSSAISLSAVSYDNSAFAATFDPADGSAAPNLKTNTQYTVHLDGGATGPLGANGASRLPVAYEFSFTTATNSLIATTTPAASATSVSIATNVCVDFVGTITQSSLTASGNRQITLTYTDAFGRTAAVPLQGTPYAVSSSRGLTNNVVCLNVAPTATPCFPGLQRLLYSTTYTLNVSTLVDIAGAKLPTAYAGTFTTGAAPALGTYTVRNSVVSEAVTAGATEVPFNGALTVTFTEDMLPSTLVAANVAIVNPSTLVPLTSTITLDDAAKPRAVTLSGTTLSPDTAYALRIYGGSGGVSLADGRYLGQDVLVPFRTNPQATLSAPSIGSLVYESSSLQIVSSRDLHLPSVTSSSLHARRSSTKLPTLVAQQPLQRRAISILPVPTWTDGATGYEIVATASILDARGTPVSPATFGTYEGKSTSALASHKPTTALCASAGSCAVQPGPGATPQDFTFTFTLPGNGYDERMQLSSYYPSAADGTQTGTVTFETTGGTGCTAGTLLPIRVEPLVGGAAADQVRITLIGPTYPKASCTYALKIRQAQTANLFNLAPATTSCTSNGTTVTDVISSTGCHTTNNPQPGILYTGETTAPTLTTAEVQALPALGLVTAGATAGTTDVYGGTSLKLTFSEAINPTTVTSTTVRLRADNATSGTLQALTYTVVGNVVTATPAARLVANKDYFIVVNGVADFAGNTSTSTTRQFKTENTAPAVQSITFSATATRTAPYGLATITFSEPVDPSTVTGNTASGVGSLSLLAGATELYGCLAVSTADPKIVTWAPDSAIAGGTVVTLSVNPTAAATKVKDQTGTQVPVPGTAPTFTR